MKPHNNSNDRRSVVRALFILAAGLFALTAIAEIPGKSSDKPIRITDLTAIEEKGLPPSELEAEFNTAVGGSFPDAITRGNYPQTYTSANFPYSVTAGNRPNVITSGNMPNVYVSGHKAETTGEIAQIPMPKLNF
jgi:hypothetical protein